MNIEMRQLRFFCALAKELNFRKAAAALNMTQPALSRAIQQLEARLGETLLIRSRSGVTLTPAGIVLQQEALGLQQRARQLQDRVHQAASGKQGTMRIGYTDFAMSGILPGIIKAFRHQYPLVELALIRSSSGEQIKSIAAEELDVGFLSPPIHDSQLDSVTVQTDTLMALLWERHPLGASHELSLSALADEAFIFGTEAHWQHFTVNMQSLCLQHGFLPQIAARAQSGEAIFGLIAAQMGVSLYPSCVSNFTRRGVIARPLYDCNEKIDTRLTWHKTQTSAVARRFIDFVDSIIL